MANKIDVSGFDDAVKQYDLTGFDSSQPEEYSALGAGAMGAVKGATFAFDDEIGGIAKALYDKGVKGKKDDFWDLYTKVRDSIRQEHTTAEEQQPVASFAGEMVGGIAPMALAPGALVGKAALKGADWLTKAKTLGVAGAKAGALYGAGASEGDLTKGDVGQVAKDVAVGGTSGAVIGGIAIPAIAEAGGKVLGGAKKIATSFPIVNENIDLFKKSVKGMDLLGKQNETTAVTHDVAQGFADTLETMRGLTGKARQAKLTEADATGLKFQVGQWADEQIAKAENLKLTANDDEKKIIDGFIQKIKAQVQEVETPTTSYVPLEKNQIAAELTPDDKAMSKVQSKMTKSVLADEERARQIEASIKEDVTSGKINPLDEKDAARLNAKIKKIEQLRSGNKFAPEIQKEAGTEMEAVINPRGQSKQPIVETILPAAPPKETPFDANVAKVKSIMIERGKTEMTPTEIDAVAKSLNESYRRLPENEGMGRKLYGDARSAIKSKFDDVDSNTKEDAIEAFNKAIEGYAEETGRFIGVAKTQERLGQPGFAAVSGETDKIMQLQRMIQNYNKPGSGARLILDQALEQLEKSFPQDVPMIRKLIQDASTNRDLAMGLSSQSPLATNMLNASARAVTMNITRLSGLAYGGILKYGGAGARNSSEALISTGNAIYGASPGTIQNMVDAATTKGGAFGNMIAKTLGNIIDAPDSKRRAVLFTLMQQPDFREFAREHMAEDTNE